MNVKVEVLGAGVMEELAVDMERAERVIQNALTGTAQDIQVDFQTTTQTWRRRPGFAVREEGQYSRIIGTEDEIYGYVNYGTGPHLIRPVNARRLAFPANYQAKTSPGNIGSSGGGSSGPTVYANAVMHPGTAARKFDEAIADKWEKLWPAILERALLAELE